MCYLVGRFACYARPVEDSPWEARTERGDRRLVGLTPWSPLNEHLISGMQFAPRVCMHRHGRARPGRDFGKCFGCFAHQLRLGCELDLVLQVSLGMSGVAHASLDVQQRCALFGVQMATPFESLFRADKSWND